MKSKTQKRTRALSWLLSLALMLSLVPSLGLTALAANEYSGGTGTKTDPWLISNVNDWEALAADVNGGTDYSGKYFKQTADLDMSSATDLAPVGNLEAPFAGNYSGNGFTLSGATINVVLTSDAAVAGVFGVLTGGGSVSNLRVTNATVTATTGNGGWDQAYAGGLVALAEDSTVTGCSVSNSTITASGENTFAGAFVGFAGADSGEKTEFSKCASENNTVNTAGYGGGFVGAIVNTTDDDAISFTDCYSANSTADAGTHYYGTVGGFLGGSQGEPPYGNMTVQNCFVYNCIATATGRKGLFTGDTTYGTVKATNCYYYDTHELTVNAEGATAKTADDMKSLASALGDAFADGDLYPVIAHKHSFTYTADGATITATCSESGCDLTENKVTLTIVPNPVLYYDDGQPKEASLEGLEAFNAATGNNITTDNISYYKGDTNVTAQIKAGSGTSIKGATYTARLDVEGKRATVTFKLTAKPTPHTHSFTYTAEGNVITATCTQNASNMEACDLTDKQATLTLNAPAHQTYGDGLEAAATLIGEIPGVNNPTIHYSKGSATLDSAPIDAGTYTAWCQLGNTTARVEYTIDKAINPGYTTLPQAKANLVYTGEEQELITAGVTSTGQIAYTVGTDPDHEPDVEAGGMPYSYSVPKMTAAGTYYVWCRLDGGKNYTSLSAQKVKVEITQATAPAVDVPTPDAVTYDPAKKLADIELPTGWAWVESTTVPTVNNSGYAAALTVDGANYDYTGVEGYNANTQTVTRTVALTVNKANSTSATVAANNHIYDGTEQPLVTVDESTLVGGTMQYKLGENGTYSENIPTATNAGDYTVYYKVVGDDNHTDSAEGSVNVKISKRNVTLTSATASKEYDGTPLTNDEVTVSGDGFVNGEGAQYTVTGTRTLVGVSENEFDYELNNNTFAGNYNIQKNNGTLTVTNRDAKYEITLKANSGEYTYDGTEKTVSGFETTEFVVEGNTYTVSDMTAETKATNAGNYAVNVTGTPKVEDANHNDVSEQFAVNVENGKLTIAKASITVAELPTASEIRTGNALSSSTITGGKAVFGDNEVPGTFAWADGTIMPTVDDSDKTEYDVIFTPDSENFDVATAKITLTVRRRSSGGGGSSVSSYTVKFDTNGGNELKNVSVKKGQTIGTIETPKKSGFVFTGWYSDKELTKPYSADEKVSASTTLYAGWKVDPVREFILTIGKKEATVWNEAKSNDVAPIIRNDRTMLPARFVAENLGATVEWIGDEQKVLITKDDLKTEIYIDSNKAYVNGEEVILDSPAFIENDRTYTPVRFIAEALSAQVDWDEESKQVIIKK